MISLNDYLNPMLNGVRVLRGDKLSFTLYAPTSQWVVIDMTLDSITYKNKSSQASFTASISDLEKKGVRVIKK